MLFIVTLAKDGTFMSGGAPREHWPGLRELVNQTIDRLERGDFDAMTRAS